MILKILSIKSAEPRKNVVVVDSDGKKEHSDRTKLGERDKVSGSEVEDN